VTPWRSVGLPFSRGSSSGFAGGHVALAVVGDEGQQLRVQRDVAVVVQLADRDVQPVPGADLHDRVVLEADQLVDPQPGPDQDFADDADEQAGLVLGGA
jgi:hypothetical protein